MTAAPLPHLDNMVYTLGETLLALSCVANFDDCLHMPLEVGGGHLNYGFRDSQGWFPNGRGRHGLCLPSVSQAWTLLTGLLSYPDYEDMSRTGLSSVASAKGWTLILGTLQPVAPSLVRPHITVHRGVPARYQERRKWVADAMAQGEMVCQDRVSGFMVTEFKPGENMQLQSATYATLKRPKIGVSSNGFEVMQIIELASEAIGESVSAYIQTGYRELQELCWQSIVLPPCRHGGKSYETAVIPTGCAAFSGWRDSHPPINGSHVPWDPNHDVNLAMTFGNTAAQWALLFSVSGKNAKHFEMRNWTGVDTNVVTYVKHAECCIDCAAHIAKADRPGHPKILVL